MSILGQSVPRAGTQRKGGSLLAGQTCQWVSFCGPLRVVDSFLQQTLLNASHELSGALCWGLHCRVQSGSVHSLSIGAATDGHCGNCTRESQPAHCRIPGSVEVDTGQESQRAIQLLETKLGKGGGEHVWEALSDGYACIRRGEGKDGSREMENAR